MITYLLLRRAYLAVCPTIIPQNSQILIFVDKKARKSLVE